MPQRTHSNRRSNTPFAAKGFDPSPRWQAAGYVFGYLLNAAIYLPQHAGHRNIHRNRLITWRMSLAICARLNTWRWRVCSSTWERPTRPYSW